MKWHKRGRGADQQRRFQIYHEEVLVGTPVPDLIGGDPVVADTKVTEDFAPTHAAKSIGYLAVTEPHLAM